MRARDAQTDRGPRRCRTEARYRTVSHDRTADQPHEFLGCDDFFGQGSTMIKKISIKTTSQSFVQIVKQNYSCTKFVVGHNSKCALRRTDSAKNAPARKPCSDNQSGWLSATKNTSMGLPTNTEKRVQSIECGAHVQQEHLLFRTSPANVFHFRTFAGWLKIIPFLEGQACFCHAHYVLVSNSQWRPFWLTTQLCPKKWLDWVAKWCELWRMHTGSIWLQSYQQTLWTWAKKKKGQKTMKRENETWQSCDENHTSRESTALSSPWSPPPASTGQPRAASGPAYAWSSGQVWREELKWGGKKVKQKGKKIIGARSKYNSVSKISAISRVLINDQIRWQI